MNLKSYFKDQRLLDQALVHRSYLNEHRRVTQSNERLEFLGDAVLELVITQHLYAQFPHRPEGALTALRSALVKTSTLGQVAANLGVGESLKMSRGEADGGGRTNLSLLANTLEAVIGALYLDQGLPQVRTFIADHLLPLLPDIITRKLYQDFKSSLQETVQARGLPAPNYQVVSVTGPDHNRQFTVTVSLSGQILGQGTGPTKQTAQTQAAHTALEKLAQTK
jgi:ribonuclease III